MEAAARVDVPTSPGELVRRAQGGSADAFEELIRRYERMALSVAYSVLGSGGEAGDVVQEGFLRAWQRLADLKEPEKFGSWVCGIVRHFALDVRRRRARGGGGPGGGGDGNAVAAPAGPSMRLVTDDPVEALGREEDLEQVRRAVAALDETSRTAVVMRYYDGRSSKEIGEHLGLAPAAVDMRLSRARRQLKEFLEAGPAAPGGAPEAPAKREPRSGHGG